MRRSTLTPLALAGLAVLAACGPVPLAALHPPVDGGGPSNDEWLRVLGGQARATSPVIADVNGDGANDVVVASHDGWLRVFDATGQLLPGWPAPVAPARSATPVAVESTPAVADLDGDGRVEIAVGAQALWRPDQHGGLVIFNADGSIRCRWSSPFDTQRVWGGGPPDGFVEGVFASPAVGDVDGRGTLDVVFGGWDNHIWALDAYCLPLTGFPYHHDDTIWASAALANIDGDPMDELFVPGDSSPGGPEHWQGGVLRSLDWTPDGVRERWKARIGDVFHSSPAIGDVNGDGRRELVIGAGEAFGHPDGRAVWAFHLDDGSLVPGWPQPVGGHTRSSPAIGDVDGDGRTDVVIGGYDGTVNAFRGDGSVIWRVDVDPRNSGPVISSPVISDLDGDGDPDVGIGDGGQLYFLDGRSGAWLRPALDGWSYENSVAVGAFPQGWRLVAAGFHGDARNDGSVRAIPIPTPGAPPAWPQWRGGPAQRGHR